MSFKIFVLNHPAFESRRKYIVEKLFNQDIEFEIVDGFPPDEIDYEELTKDFHLYYQIPIYQVKNYSYHNFPKKISRGSLSLVLKHIDCWKNQIEESIDKILILEDDCEIPENFQDLLNEVLSEMNESQLDMVMLGGFMDFTSPNIMSGKKVHYHPLQKTRCTHAYIVDKRCVRNLFDGFSNINNPIDIKLNEVIQINQLRVGWLEPGLKQIEI